MHLALVLGADKNSPTDRIQKAITAGMKEDFELEKDIPGLIADIKGQTEDSELPPLNRKLII